MNLFSHAFSRPILLALLLCFCTLSASSMLYRASLNTAQFEHAKQNAARALSLAQKELSLTPHEAWALKLDNLNALPPKFTLTKIEQLNLPSHIAPALLNGEVLYLDDFEAFFIRIEQSEFALSLEYLAEFSWISYLEISFILLNMALFSAILAYFSRKIRQESNALAHVSAALGREQTLSRAHLHPQSPLLPIAQQLNETARALADLADQRKTLIDGISHDLRTPIARLRYRLEALSSATTENPFAIKVLTQANRDLDSLNAMTEELLIFSRLDRPELNVHPQTVELAHWLLHLLQEFNEHNTAIELHYLYGEQALDLVKLDEQGDMIELCAKIDPYYMGRAIINLLSNAQRYGNGQIIVLIEENEHAILIHVDDNGAGIPESARQSVFRPFSRLDAARQRTTGGHGLGLAIVKKVVDAHHGQIVISDAPLGGARMSIILQKQEKIT